jgi:integrase/recombinase XerD
MIELMTYHNYSLRTHEAYLYHVNHLARYYHRSPEQITEKEVEQWLMFLFLKKKLAPASDLMHLNFYIPRYLKKRTFC